MILVGGQALVAWVSHFGLSVPKTEAPFLTQDVDFHATRQEAHLLASILGAEFKAATLDDAGTPNTAIAELRSAHDKRLLIDFLSGLIGVENREIQRLSVPVSFDEKTPIYILHPLLCLQSRFENLEHLEIKRDGNGIAQARVAVDVTRAYLESLHASDEHREAGRAAKRVAKIAASKAGRFVFNMYDIDPLIANDPALYPWEKYRTEEWPRLVAHVTQKRQVDLDRKAAT